MCHNLSIHQIITALETEAEIKSEGAEAEIGVETEGAGDRSNLRMKGIPWADQYAGNVENLDI